MKLALIADVYWPSRTSAAIQLRDLAEELGRQGHLVTAIIPGDRQDEAWVLEDGAVRVLRVRSFQTKNVGYVRRTIGEFLLPFVMLRTLRQSPLANEQWDGIIWYSPTIFLGPAIYAMKRRSNCRGYLIVRDIFPEWAVDMGLMSRGLPYHLFRAVARFQYSVADAIGVQTSGNLAYFSEWKRVSTQHVEVLHNWLAEARDMGCSISLDQTPLAGRKIFVYAGNMGVAQGMDILLDLAERLLPRADIGFLFVGRGSDAQRLARDARLRGLDNVLFRDEISPDEIPGLYAQCHLGLVALDPRHRTHNIPGKFLTYMQAGLPVFAAINPGNDLVDLITEAQVGRACVERSATALQRMAEELVDSIDTDMAMPGRCKALFARLFSPQIAAEQIVGALQTEKKGSGRSDDVPATAATLQSSVKNRWNPHERGLI